uniref:BLOC-1-related complex subunit 5 n=1 Tax=Steinernema glaseri TaxID=37863 RepID=A0A1I8AHF0_9BILA
MGNPDAEQHPLSDAPASISSDTPTANSVLANTPGIANTPGPASTAPQTDGQHGQTDSNESEADVPACITHADPLNEAKHLMLNVIPKEVEDVLRFLSAYLQSEYEVNESQGSDLGLMGGPPSVADPPSVNDLQNGPGSVSVMDEPHSVGGALRVDAEGLKNYCDSAVKAAVNCLASIDSTLGRLEVVKQSLAHVHSVEKSLHAQAVPSVPPQQLGGNSGQNQQSGLSATDTNVVLTQQATERLQYQNQLSQAMTRGAEAIRSLLAHSMHLPVESMSNGFMNDGEQNRGHTAEQDSCADADFDAEFADNNLCEAAANVKTEAPDSMERMM